MTKNSLSLLRVSFGVCTALLWAACGEDTFSSSSKGTVIRKYEQQEVAQVAQMLANHQQSAGQEIDVLTLLQQQHGWDNTTRAHLKGCGKVPHALSNNTLLFYPTQNTPAGILLISPGFMFLPKTGMQEFIDTALDNNLSVLLLQLAGQKESNKDSDKMSANTWKREEKAAMCLLAAVQKHNQHPQAFMMAHSMSAPLAELALADEFLGQWAESGKLRLVNVSPAYELSVGAIDPDQAVALKPQLKLLTGNQPLGKLFAGDNAAHDDVPDQGIYAVTRLQQEARSQTSRARIPVLNLFHDGDIVVDPNKAPLENNLRYKVRTPGGHGPSIDDWAIMFDFWMHHKLPPQATDDPKQRYATTVPTGLLSSFL